MSGTFHSVTFTFRIMTYLPLIDSFEKQLFDAFKQSPNIERVNNLEVWVAGWFTEKFTSVVQDHLPYLLPVEWPVEPDGCAPHEWWAIREGKLMWCLCSPDDNWSEIKEVSNVPIVVV